MEPKRTGLSLCFCFVAVFFVQGQRILTEARLDYQLTPLPQKGQETAAEAFKNAGFTIWLRANMVRTDFFSQNLRQSVIYNATTGKTTLLRESGSEKYQWNLDSMQWKKHNQKWVPQSFEETGETAVLAGYDCLKTIARFSGGDSAIIFYTRQILPLASGYDPLFEGLKGLPVQYEWTIGGVKIRYKLTSVQTGQVVPVRFEIPVTGYKIIEAPE